MKKKKKNSSYLNKIKLTKKKKNEEGRERVEGG